MCVCVLCSTWCLCVCGSGVVAHPQCDIPHTHAVVWHSLYMAHTICGLVCVCCACCVQPWCECGKLLHDSLPITCVWCHVTHVCVGSFLSCPHVWFPLASPKICATHTCMHASACCHKCTCCMLQTSVCVMHDGGAAALLLLQHEQASNKQHTTLPMAFNEGCLSSCNDEERSQMR